MKRSAISPSVLLCLIFAAALFFYTAAPAEAKIHYDEGIQKVREHIGTKAFQEAENLLREMLSQYPDNPELLDILGRVLYWEKKYDESIEIYNRLLEVKPSQKADEDKNKVISSKELQSAEALKGRGQFKEAEEKLRALYETGRERYSAGYSLGMLYIRQREYEKAVKIFSEMKTYYPDDSGFEELYIESLILDGEIQKAKTALTELSEQRRDKLYVTREDFFYRIRRNYLKLSASAVDYTDGMDNETQYEIQLGQRIGERPFVFSYSSIKRFGENDGQAGLEIYSKLGEKTKRWGYLFLTAGTKAAFLPKWTAGAYIYQGYGKYEFSVGYSHMEFNDTSVNLLTPGVIVYLPYEISLNESLSINLKNSTTSLLSKLHYEPNHKFNCFYSYSFGKSAEKIGALQDIAKIGHYAHTIGAEYRVREYFSFGAEYKFSSRENSYKQKGTTVFAKVWW